MAIQTQVWIKEIAKNLFPDDSFIIRGKKDDAYVENKKVNVSQSGAVPTVVRNRTTIPATGVGRTDVAGDYDIDEFTSTPTIIKDIEEIETSYNKRMDVITDHSSEINKQIANWMSYHWAATSAASIVRTSGANRPAFVTGATGTRKTIQLTDWLAVKRILDNMDVPDDGRRFALVPAEMYNDMLEIDKVLSAEFNLSGKLPKGVVNEIFGIKIFKRSATVSYTNAATPVLRDPEANVLTTANAGAIFWHEDFVRRAKGAVKVYTNIDDPTLYGSAFSAMARAGGRKVYSDGKGVVSLVEAAGV